MNPDPETEQRRREHDERKRDKDEPNSSCIQRTKTWRTIINIKNVLNET